MRAAAALSSAWANNRAGSSFPRRTKPAPMYGYTQQDTVNQVHGVGPWGIEYLDPEDDPRS